ncbi:MULTISPECIES: universal stress protein [unclassified Nonomuraea]|uniref:universal stress protein n=1 Tax=Nonomuraea sp. NPDC003804 TaxID=3154547 RepID=UPI0033A3B588
MLSEGPRVVVGVDDTPASRWALLWAVEAARLRGMALVAVHVSRAPVHPFPEALPYTHTVRQMEEARSVELIQTLFDDMTGGAPPDINTLAVARLGEPGPLLVELARPIDLLVVGRGHRSGLDRLLMPSTRRYCTGHARCPVVVVPTPPAADQRTGALSRPAWIRWLSPRHPAE